MNKTILLLACWACNFFVAISQPVPIRTHRLPGKPLENSWWLQYNPLNIIEPEIPLAVTATYKAGSQVSIGLDAGLFLAYNDYISSLEPYHGLRLKPEIKFFPAGAKFGPRYFYIALQGLIKLTSRPKEEWLQKFDSSGQVLFNRFVKYKEKKNVFGANILFGSEFIMGAKKRFMIDVYLGCGLRTKQFRAVGLPDGFSVNYDNRDDWFSSIFYNGIYPSFAAGFKMGYRIF